MDEKSWDCLTNGEQVCIYLLDEAYVDFENLEKKLKTEGTLIHQNYKQSDSLAFRIFMVTYVSNAPSWLKFASELMNQNLELPTTESNSSFSAGLFIKIKNIQYLLCFGRKKNIFLDNIAYKSNFGFRVVANLLEKSNINLVKSTSIQGKHLKKTGILSKGGSIGDFNIDHLNEIINTLGCTLFYSDKSKMSISGNDSLKIKLSTNYRTIVEFLDFLFKMYNDQSYKQKYPWIDLIAEISDLSFTNILYNELFEDIYHNKGAFELSISENNLDITQMEELSIFTNIKNGSVFSFYALASVFQEKIQEITYPDFLKSSKQNKNFLSIRYKHSETGRYREIPFLNNIIYKCEFQNKHCILLEGKWYEINNNVEPKINILFEKHLTTQYSDPNYSTIDNDISLRNASNEEKYNIALNKRFQGILMDKVNINVIQQYSKFEVFDFCHNNNIFHVKIYSGSSTLSHLFNQGHHSALLLQNDKKIAEKILKKIKKANPDKQLPLWIEKLGKKEIETTKLTVSFLISQNNDNNPYSLMNIPLFSKISFLKAKSRLESYGYKVFLFLGKNTETPLQKQNTKNTTQEQYTTLL